MMEATELVSRFSSHLFWDVDTRQIDMDRHARYVIQRVLEYGLWNDWKLVREYYGLDRIVAEVKQMRMLDPVALAYICAITNTKETEYGCYHFLRSNPTLWYF